MLEKMLYNMCLSMGMAIQKENPFGCGVYLCGDGTRTRGYFWYLVHEKYFVITKCDFIFLEDIVLKMQDKLCYIALRLDYGRHLPPGKVIAFFEEQGNPTSTVMHPGNKIAYTEVMYAPIFYKKHFGTAFTSAVPEPLTILKNMGADHNWSLEMMNALAEIQKSNLLGMSAELYYVAKAYELMSALIDMGSDRILENSADAADILRVIEYINSHYTDKIKQSSLVHIANMSPTKLKKLFKQFTGHTITEYILLKKADQAVHLLSDSALSIEEISKCLGFETVAGFSTSFKKQLGIPPSKYRKQIQIECFENPSSTQLFRFS